jgi:bacillithiol system protein YtxJ
MNAQLVAVTSPEGIDQLLQQSMDAPVVLFNFDPYCPISLQAYAEVTRLPREIAVVNVARDTDVTGYISERTGVTHESPQILLLHHGAAVWSASHFDITQATVSQALARAGGAPDGAAS